MAGWYQARQKKKAGVTRLCPFPVSQRESKTTLLRRVGFRRVGLLLGALRLLGGGLLLAFGLLGFGLAALLVSLRGISRRRGRRCRSGRGRLRGILRRGGLRHGAKGRNRENRGDQGGDKLAHLWLPLPSRYWVCGRNSVSGQSYNARGARRLTAPGGLPGRGPGGIQ